VLEDEDAMAWLASRALDADHVALWDLARVLHTSAALPTWARCRGPWTATGHRLLIPLFDAAGDLVSVRARCLRDPGDLSKSLAPAAFSVRGLVFADPLAQQLLRSGPPDWWHPRDVVITEGEPDFLTWASRQGDGHEQGPAVLGVVSGSWTEEIASRLPDEARIAVRTHRDAAGEEYARAIVATLGRRCRVFRAAGAAS
jgi:hypothetical protein